MRPLSATGQPAPLGPQEIKEIRDKHLMYRRALLMDAVARIPALTMADNQAFEAGAAAGRSLLSFLGLRYDRKAKELAQDRSYQREDDNQTDDVKAPDVGGHFVEIRRLSKDQRKILARFIHGVHKASAHFTWKSRHEMTVPTYQATAPLIIELLQTHVYQVEPVAPAEPPPRL
jgi:hypothetical protein